MELKGRINLIVITLISGFSWSKGTQNSDVLSYEQSHVPQAGGYHLTDLLQQTKMLQYWFLS